MIDLSEFIPQFTREETAEIIGAAVPRQIIHGINGYSFELPNMKMAAILDRLAGKYNFHWRESEPVVFRDAEELVDYAMSTHDETETRYQP
jgi:bifunctional pyridoxal-dependent enzyme with beta-cystathionase and maltose regulon repressor activities